MNRDRQPPARHAARRQQQAQQRRHDGGLALAHQHLPRQRVLLALTQAGVSREDAYRLVQRNAMKVWDHRTDFREELLADEEVRAALSEDEINEKFDLGYHTKHVDTIFARVFKDS